jgi:cytochrome c biogenesis protein CcmG/thiol:disulfide interchange protein DsbE
MSIRFLFAVSLLLLGVFSAPLYSQEQEACTVQDKSANLDFTLEDMHGAEVKLSDYAGKVILLDFWATWCAPCRIEIPGFIELLDKYEDRGLAILGISVDDPVSSLQLYAEEMQMDYPVLIGDGRDDVKDTYGPLLGFPTTFLINRDGDICYQHTGFAPKEQFEQEILQLL